MEKDLKVLLIEDNADECRAILEYINENEGVRLVNVTNSPEKAIAQVVENLPDAIILDMELNKGSGTGISFMQSLKEKDLALFPYILVTTKNDTLAAHDEARDAGADFIMGKYDKGYSAEMTVKFLKSMSGFLQRKRQQSKVADVLSKDEIEETSNRIVKKINAHLDLIGINPKAVGRKYLIEGIVRIINKSEPNISTEIAAKFGKATPSVERAMQNAIASAWKASPADELTKFYTARINPARGMPTVMELIHYYATKIKSELGIWK
ncbi:MAG: response regulator [Oscillospiraceae bacterium]|nr:response regulator [Oscillospiraceae bacterium]